MNYTIDPFIVATEYTQAGKVNMQFANTINMYLLSEVSGPCFFFYKVNFNNMEHMWKTFLNENEYIPFKNSPLYQLLTLP